MNPSCSGIILAGGRSRRLGGENKALLQVDGQPILDRLCKTFRKLFNDLVLVTNSPETYLAWDLAVVTDLFPLRSALTGIHAGLCHIPTPYAFVSACDMPFLKGELVEILLRDVADGWDVVIPVTAEGHQPLCAVYSKRCIKPIARQLERGGAKIADFFSQVRVKTVAEPPLRAVDPDLVSFFNVNTPEDRARL